MTGKRFFILLGISIVALVLLLFVALSHQRSQQLDPVFTVPSESGDGRFRLPRPTDFPVTAEMLTDDARASEVDFDSDPRAREHASVMAEGFAAGPNFAGFYTVVTWGCGTACQQSAIIDARTGNIVEFGILSSFGVAYATSSKLFAVNPRDRLDAAGVNAPRVASDYYIFEDNVLRHILKVAEDGTFERACPPLEVVATNPLTSEERTFGSPCAVPAGWGAR